MIMMTRDPWMMMNTCVVDVVVVVVVGASEVEVCLETDASWIELVVAVVVVENCDSNWLMME